MVERLPSVCEALGSGGKVTPVKQSDFRGLAAGFRVRTAVTGRRVRAGIDSDGWSAATMLPLNPSCWPMLCPVCASRKQAAGREAAGAGAPHQAAVWQAARKPNGSRLGGGPGLRQPAGGGPGLRCLCPTLEVPGWISATGLWVTSVSRWGN